MLDGTKHGIKEDSTDNEPEHELGQHEGLQCGSECVVLHHKPLQGVQPKGMAKTN